MTSFRRSLSALGDRALEQLILSLSERKLDAEVSRRAAPNLNRKWAIAVNERRHRRIAQQKLPLFRRAA